LQKNIRRDRTALMGNIGAGYLAGAIAPAFVLGHFSFVLGHG
jgi:hypothetical protein